MTQPDRRYRPDIDGLRALAVGAVLIYHAFPARLPGGFIGVDIFFVISGYLISGIILGGVAAGRFTFRDFYARRIRRIFPALGAVLAAVLAAGWFVLYAADFARLGRHAAAAAAFAANLSFWQEASYFDLAADLKPLLHLWSLGVEEQFYLVWPVLLFATARWRRGPLALTLSIGAMSFAAAAIAGDASAAFYAPWNRFWELLAGAVLACIEADAALVKSFRQLQQRRAFANAIAAAGLSLIVAGVLLIDGIRVFQGPWLLLPVAGAFLLVAAGAGAWVNRAIFSNPAAVGIGLISYPLYLWHWPLLSFAHIVGGGVPPGWLRLAALGVAALLAWLTYLLIERPIRFGSTRLTAVPVLALSVVLVCAVTIAATGGVPSRALNHDRAGELIEHYARARRTGLGEAYRRECDFMDWQTEKLRAAIDRSCTAPGRAHTVMLWGDSFAQALSLGLRESLPADTALAQVTASACAPASDNQRRCDGPNRFAMETITRLRPDLVVLAQFEGHARTDWTALAIRVLALGARHVVIAGPLPVWRPALPSIYARHHLDDRADYVSTGLDLDNFAADRTAAASVAGLANVTYLSMLDQLCRAGERTCLARVPGEHGTELMAVDFGHLSAKGSSYLGRKLWRPYLERVIR